MWLLHSYWSGINISVEFHSIVSIFDDNKNTLFHQISFLYASFRSGSLCFFFYRNCIFIEKPQNILVFVASLIWYQMQIQYWQFESDSVAEILCVCAGFLLLRHLNANEPAWWKKALPTRIGNGKKSVFSNARCTVTSNLFSVAYNSDFNSLCTL